MAAPAAPGGLKDVRQAETAWQKEVPTLKAQPGETTQATLTLAFPLWYKRLRASLFCHDVSEIIDMTDLEAGQYAPAGGATADQKDQYRYANALVHGTLVLKLDELSLQLADHDVTYGDGRGLAKALIEVYEPSTGAQIAALTMQVMGCMWGPSDTTDQFFSRLITGLDRLVRLNAGLPQAVITAILVRTIPADRYLTVVSRAEAARPPMTAMMAWRGCQATDATRKASGLGVAFSTHATTPSGAHAPHSERNRAPQTSTSRSGRRDAPPRTVTCWYCAQTGHPLYTCPLKAAHIG